jgi:hypothetical protein
MIYIIYDSGVFSFTLSRKNFVLCVLDISLCDRGLISARILVEAIMYLTVAYNC